MTMFWNSIVYFSVSGAADACTYSSYSEVPPVFLYLGVGVFIIFLLLNVLFIFNVTKRRDNQPPF